MNTPFLSGLSFFNSDFCDLVNCYERYENFLYGEVSKSFLLKIESLGAKIKGNHFFIDNSHYSFSDSYEPISRIIIITLVAAGKDLKRTPKREVFPVNAIGRIRAIEIICDEALYSKIAAHTVYLTTLIQEEYIKYEWAFLSKYEQANKRLTENLYEILNAKLSSENKNNLIGYYWITITKLVNSGSNNDKFTYAISQNLLPQILASFKANQIDSYSPLELLISILTTETIDEAVKIFNENVLSSNIFFDAMEIQGSDNYKFWLGQKIMFADPAIGFYYFVLEKNYLLSIDHPKAYHEDLKIIIEMVVEDLQHQLKINLTRYKANFSPLPKKKKALLKVITGNLVDFAAKVTAEFLKP